MRVALVLYLVLQCVSVRAEENNRVLVTVDGNESIARKIAKELQALGFDAVVVNEVDFEITPKALADMARSKEAMAAIRAGLKKSVVEVWIADRVTDKIVYRSVEISLGRESIDSVVTLASVELLRASLMEIQLDQTVQEEVPPSRQVEVFANPGAQKKEKVEPPPRLSGDVGLGVAFIGRNTGVPIIVNLELNLRVAGEFHLAVVGSIPMIRGKQTYSQGDVWYGPGLLGGEIFFVGRSTQVTLRPLAGIGIGTSLIAATGNGKPGYASFHFLTWSFMPLVRVGLLFRISKNFALRVHARGGVSPANHTIQVLGSDVAEIGRWWLSGVIEAHVSLM